MFSGLNVLRADFAKTHKDSLRISFSQGYLFFYDEVAVFAVQNDGEVERRQFIIKNEKDTTVGCMWWDQLVAASKGFPYDYEDSPDRERFGIHFVS